MKFYFFALPNARSKVEKMCCASRNYTGIMDRTHYIGVRGLRGTDLCPGPGSGLKSLPGSRPGSRVTLIF